MCIRDRGIDLVLLVSKILSPSSTSCVWHDGSLLQMLQHLLRDDQLVDDDALLLHKIRLSVALFAVND